MSDSGKYVNYNLRTSKSIERRMILIAAKELLKDVDILKSRYIGMGSTYFTDFKLFHRELHIEKMISIEVETKLLKRIEFNKPYKCIEIIQGSSNDVLPNLDWRQKLTDIIWMDYDGELSYEIFNDVEHIFGNIQPGSIYLMSCNRQLKNETLGDFKKKFGELVPNGTSQIDFTGEKSFLLIRKMLTNKIQEVLINRNHLLNDKDKLEFRQLFFFTYQDNAPMLSLGGYLARIDNDMANFRLDYDFIKRDSERYVIDPPHVSYKEIGLLNSHLPNSEIDYINEISLDFIPEHDRKKYRQYYRYLPNYMDVTF